MLPREKVPDISEIPFIDSENENEYNSKLNDWNKQIINSKQFKLKKDKQWNTSWK